MRRRGPERGRATRSGVEDYRRSEAGDTLVEILIALTVIGVAATAILLAFATAISGSGAHRNVATMDTMLRTAAAEVTADIQNQYSQAAAQPTSAVGQAVANCAGANLVGPISLPTAGYTAAITSTQFWQGTQGNPNPVTNPVFAFTAAQAPSSYTTCPPNTSPNGPQQVTVTVSFNGTSQQITTTVQAPQAPTSGRNCLYRASQLVWVQQPDNGNAGSALFPAPTVVVEDKTGCVVQNDLSQVQLAINSGPTGATLRNCVPSLGYGETTFQNCTLSTIGTYTLSVTDPTDSITTPVAGNSFTITAGVPAQLVFKQQPVNGTGGVPFATSTPNQPITVQIEDASGNPIQGDTSTVTLAIGTNPNGNGTLSGCTGTTTNGLATITGCKIDKAANGYTLTATDAADNLTVPSVPSAPFNIAVGPAFQLGFTTSPGTTVAGDPFGTQPVVAVQDAGGNTVTSNTSTVSLAIGTNPGGGTLSGCSETTTAGVATFNGCKIDKPGNGYTLVASDGTLQPGTSNAFNIVTPALTSFKVVPATNTPTAGTAFNVTITALDQSGFTFPGTTGNQTIAFTGPSPSPNGTLPIYTNPVNFSGGIGTTSITLYDAQTTTLKATQGSVTGTSGNITVSALATPVAFTVTNPGPQTAGTAFNETIIAADQYGNPATGYTGNHTLTFTGPSNAPNGKAPSYPGQVNFSSGTGTANITLYDAQTATLKATATGPSLTGTSTSFTVSPGTPGAFSVSNPGTPQTAGTPFSVTITATDSYGNAAGNYTGVQTLGFSGPANSPNGTAPVYPASVTFASGVGTASGITLYDAQTTSLTVTQGAATGNSGNFTVNGTGTVGSFVLSNVGTQTAGTAFNVTITAADQYGNAATGYANGNHTLTFTGPSSSPNGTAPLYPAQVSFTNGIGTANVTLYDAQTTTLTASATGPSLTGTSNSFAVNGKPGSAFSVTNPGTQTVGVQFNVTITAVDAYGNTDVGYQPPFFSTVALSGPLNAPDGTAPAYAGNSCFFGCFTNGVLTVQATLYDAQSTTLTASVNGVVGTSTSFTVNAGPVVDVTVSGYPSPTTAGSTHNVTVTALDSYDNTATGYTGTVHFTSSDGQAVLPANYTFTGGDNGLHTFTNGVTLKTAGTQSITATDTVTGTISGTQSGISVLSGTATTLTVSGFPSPTTAGAAHSVTVTAHDAFGNTATGYTGTVHFTSTDGAAVLPANYTFTGGDAGVHTFTNGATLKTAGTQSITATDTVTGTITGTQSGITVQVGPATTFVVAGFPSPTTAGAAHSITVTARDAGGNTATGYTGTVHFTSTDPQATAGSGLPANYTFVAGDNGVHTFTNGVTLKTAGTQSITATDTVTGTITGTQSGITVQAAGASKLAFAQQPTTTTAGNAISPAVTVQVQDPYGNAVADSGATVNMTVSAGPGPFTGTSTTSATTSGAGLATFNNLVLDTSGTTYSLQAASSGLTSGTSGTFTVNAASATTLTVAGFTSPTAAGAAHNVIVTAKDAFGNTATGYTGTVHFTSTDPQATAGAGLPANYTFVAGDNGVHTFTNGVTLKTAGTQSITATDTVTGTITGTQSAISVLPGTTTTLVVSAFPSPVTAGTAHSVTSPPSDAYGNTTPGYTGTVHFTSTDGQATAGSGLPANYTFVAGDNGVHTFTNGVTLKTAGTQSITATDTVTGTITGTQSAISVLSNTATTLVVSAFPSPTTAGAAHSVTVTAHDAFGNTATGYTGTVHFTSSDGGAVLPANYTFVAGDNGVHTFTNGATLKTAGSQSITATDTVTGTITGTQSAITVNPAGAATLTVAGFTSPTTAGAAHSVTVTAKDAFGNTATGYTGTVHFTSTDGQATAGSGLPADYTFTGGDAGVHTFTNGATLKTAGSQSITATDTVTGTITGTQSAITVNPAGAATLTVAGFTSPTTAGAAHSVTVTAFDSFGNTATGYTGTVHFTSTDGQATAGAGLPANYTFVAGDNGAHTFTNGATLKTAGTQSITATDTVTGTITGTQSAITVNPAGAATLTVAGFTSPTTAGAAHSVTVTAKDAFGNTATGYTGTVHFTSTDGAAVLPANYTFTGGDAGVHTFTNGATLKTAGTQSITATDTVTGTITGTQSAITVNPAGAATLTVAGFTTPTTAGAAHSVTVTALDAFGNTATGYTGTVHFTSTDPQATAGSGLPANYTFVAGDNGVHTFTNGVTLKTAGTQSITATDTVTGTITGTQSGITVQAAGASKLAFAQQPTTTTAGNAISPAVTVQVQDLYGNAVADSGATVNMTVSAGPGPFTGTSTTSATTSGAGLATFNNLVLDTSGTTYSLQAASSGLTSGTSGTFTVNAASATTLTVAGFTSPTAAGAAHNVIVTAKDAFGNTATGYTGTVHFTSTDPQATAGAGLPANYTFVAGDNGVHTFTNGVTLKTAGTQSITATDTVTGTITGTQSAITVLPGTTTTLVVSAFPSPVTAGTAHSVTVTAFDAYGNTTPELHRHGPLHEQRRPGHRGLGPAGQLHLRRRRQRGPHLHQRGHPQDGGHPVHHGHRHGDGDHHGHPERHLGALEHRHHPRRLGLPEPDHGRARPTA